jgi:hypothetical protein
MLIRAAAIALVLVPAIASAAPPLRMVEMTFTKGEEVLSQPRIITGGTSCQRFSSGLEGQPPTVKVEYCALRDGMLRVRWSVRLGGRTVSHQAIGSYASGSAFDASVSKVLDVRVVVSDAT